MNFLSVDIKFILLCLLIAGLYFHQNVYTHICTITETESCSRLLTDGYFKNNRTYQPTGCMLHNYNARDTKQSIRQHHLLHGKRPLVGFVGDSRIRQLFVAMENLLLEKEYVYKSIHYNMFYKMNKETVSMEFRWKPRRDINEFFRTWNSTYKSDKPAPSVVVLGTGLHFLGMYRKREEGQQEEYLRQYKNSLKVILDQMPHIKNTKFIWMMQDPTQSDEEKDDLRPYNALAENVLKGHNISLWRSGKHIALMYLEESPTHDGTHLGPTALYWDTQLLLNLFCNNLLHPTDGTCCKTWPKYDIKQFFSILLFIISILVCIVLRQYILKYGIKKAAEVPAKDSRSAGCHRFMNHPNKITEGPSEVCEEHVPASDIYNMPYPMGSDCSVQLKVILVTLWNISKFIAILTYFYLCGRTDAFGAENKLYQSQHFYFPLLVLLVLGILTIRKCTNNDVLNRQQTDEWKGWMQLVILVYHYTGASKDLQIYMYIRILVSSYLFMSGYGHVIYALKHSIKPVKQVLWRSCEVLFRLNFLTVSLCLIMRTHYQFYYFVPLVSFWFLCIMLIAWLPIYLLSYLQSKESGQGNIIKECCGIAGLTVGYFILNTTLYKCQDMFRMLFSLPVVKLLFEREDGTMKEWFFRWSTDRYSSLYGILAAIGLMIFKQYNWAVILKEKGYVATRFIITFLSTAGLLVYVAAVGDICSTKPECNSFHAISCIIPIASYVILRNISQVVRSYHSLFFTWVGKFSLELFISQYHIWLAADSKGLLVIIPGYQLTNFTITTVIFVCVAHEINRITSTVTDFIFHKQSI